MKSVLLLLTCFFSISAHAITCNRPIDQKKAIVFVNMNSTFLELDAAQRAACARGERFVAIPPLTPELDTYRRSYLPWIYGVDRFQSLARQNRQMTEAENKSLLDNFNRKNVALTRIPRVTTAYLQSELRKLAATDTAVRSFIISGHDGGETMGGDMGMVSKTDAMAALKTAYVSKPRLLDSMTSMLEWGCYTATPAEVMRMKRQFPGLKIIAGFNGGGPLSIRGASYNFLEDLLKSEAQLENASSEGQVRTLINSLDNIHDGNGAVFVSACNEELYYQRGPFGKGFGNFDEFRQCPADIQAQLRLYQTQFDSFVNGITPLPTDLANNPLRDLYSYARQYQHCIGQNSSINPNRVGLIHWSAGVLKNFEQSFSPGLTIATNELNRIAMLLRATGAQLDALRSQFFPGVHPTQVQDLMNKFRGDKALIARLLLHQGGVSSMNRVEIARNMHKFDTLMTHPAMIHSRAKFPMLNRMRAALDRYVVKVDPACMDFLHWHDYQPGVIAPALCKI